MNSPFLYSKSKGRVVAVVLNETDRALVFQTLKPFYSDLKALTSAEMVKSKAKAGSLGAFHTELHKNENTPKHPRPF